MAPAPLLLLVWAAAMQSPAAAPVWPATTRPMIPEGAIGTALSRPQKEATAFSLSDVSLHPDSIFGRAQQRNLEVVFCLLWFRDAADCDGI